MKFFPSVVFRYFLIVMLVSSIPACYSKGNNLDNTAAKSDMEVASLIILPMDAPLSADRDDVDESELTKLREGAKILSSILKNIIRDRENTVFLSRNHVESLLGGYNGSEREIIHYLGRKTQADTVLQTHIFRYNKRIGSKYSVSQPASVNFSYRLIHTPTGHILCQGRFDETQQTLFSNLFSLFKASSRGFKWITAKELMKEGVEQEFKDCIYLSVQ